ncbi:MAG: hypothetical protein IKG74_05175 [Firmicutes bacterium]|nr:hypothetical protein [Bacillota bacterium]
MDAIVYTSQTGSTAKFARLLGEELRLPVYQLKRAQTDLRDGAEIIYLGWLMAGQVKGYKQAAKRFRIAALAAVGMGPAGEQVEEVRKANDLRQEMPVFTLQGGYAPGKLRFPYNLMMALAKGPLKKKISQGGDTPETRQMLELMDKGGDMVSREQLQPLLDWLESRAAAQ